MTDEEYGRAWAAENGVGPPHQVAKRKWLWYSATDQGYPALHESVCIMLDREDDFYQDEAACYAALGQAVRTIHKEVPYLRGEPRR